MKFSVIVLLVLGCLTASAQYRMVNGQIYRADDSRVWRVFSDLQVVDVMPDGSLEVCELEHHSTVSQVGGGGAYSAQTSGYTSHGATFLLLHYNTYQAPYPGMELGSIRAMLVPPVTLTDGERDVATKDSAHAGTRSSGVYSSRVTRSSEIDAVTYDAGTPWYPPQPVYTPAQITARKAAAVSNIVVNLKRESTNGDAIGQYELGERYMTGDGVKQDQLTGQMWLKKSADQGDNEASNYLANFTLTNDMTAKK